MSLNQTLGFPHLPPPLVRRKCSFCYFSAMCAHTPTHNFNFLNRITYSWKLFSFSFRHLATTWMAELSFCSFTQSFNWICFGTFNSCPHTHALTLSLCAVFCLTFWHYFALSLHTPLYSTHFSCYHCLVIRDLMLLVHAIYYKFNHNDVGNFDIHFVVIRVPSSFVFFVQRVLWARGNVVLSPFHIQIFPNKSLFLQTFLSNHTFVWLLSLSSSSLLLNDIDERNMKNII